MNIKYYYFVLHQLKQLHLIVNYDKSRQPRLDSVMDQAITITFSRRHYKSASFTFSIMTSRHVLNSIYASSYDKAKEMKTMDVIQFQYYCFVHSKKIGDIKVN